MHVTYSLTVSYTGNNMVIPVMGLVLPTNVSFEIKWPHFQHLFYPIWVYSKRWRSQPTYLIQGFLSNVMEVSCNENNENENCSWRRCPDNEATCIRAHRLSFSSSSYSLSSSHKMGKKTWLFQKYTTNLFTLYRLQ